jgi:hypothetical protein
LIYQREFPKFHWRTIQVINFKTYPSEAKRKKECAWRK